MLSANKVVDAQFRELKKFSVSLKVSRIVANVAGDENYIHTYNK